jgi:hypothetical protein
MEKAQRLRAKIHALERSADDVEAHCARGEVGPELGAVGLATDVDRPGDDISWHDYVDHTVASIEDDNQVGVECEDRDIEGVSNLQASARSCLCG